MKNKKMAIGIMLLLFVISGICNVINVSAEEIELPPLSYYAFGLSLEHNDELEIYVDSSGTVNIYIMTEIHYNTLQNSGGLTWDYIQRWQDITHLEYTFTFVFPDGYCYVVVYNKNVLFGRTVEINIKRIPYFDIIPIVLIAIGVIVVSTVLTVLLVKRSKRKKTPKKPIIQTKEFPKITYCPECGMEITDMTKGYCSQCGGKIN